MAGYAGLRNVEYRAIENKSALHWAAAIGLINLIYNLARYEQIVRLKLLPRIAA